MMGLDTVNIEPILAISMDQSHEHGSGGVDNLLGFHSSPTANSKALKCVNSKPPEQGVYLQPEAFDIRRVVRVDGVGIQPVLAGVPAQIPRSCPRTL